MLLRAEFAAVALASTALAITDSLSSVCAPSTIYVTGETVTVTVEGIKPSSTSSSGGPYFFGVIDGFTTWLNGHAPPSTETDFVLGTTTLTVTPGLASATPAAEVATTIRTTVPKTLVITVTAVATSKSAQPVELSASQSAPSFELPTSQSEFPLAGSSTEKVTTIHQTVTTVVLLTISSTLPAVSPSSVESGPEQGSSALSAGTSVEQSTSSILGEPTQEITTAAVIDGTITETSTFFGTVTLPSKAASSLSVVTSSSVWTGTTTVHPTTLSESIMTHSSFSWTKSTQSGCNSSSVNATGTSSLYPTTASGVFYTPLSSRSALNTTTGDAVGSTHLPPSPSSSYMFTVPANTTAIASSSTTYSFLSSPTWSSLTPSNTTSSELVSTGSSSFGSSSALTTQVPQPTVTSVNGTMATDATAVAATPSSFHASSLTSTQTQTTFSTLVSSSTMTSASTQTSVESATPATPSSCGESGNFTLNWDDEPVWTPSDPGSVLIPPVFSPYHHLFFSHGYGYVPPPEDPFFAVSEPRMLVFTGTKSNGTTDGPDHAGIIPGEIGAGPRNELDAFWFDAYSIWMGCENAGPASCTVRLTGYVWDSSMGQEKMVTEQMATIPPCIGLRDCHLSKINLNDNFRALTGVKFEAAVLGAPVTFYADDFAAAWWNNGCAAGLERQRSRKL